MSHANRHKDMLVMVASALTPKLLEQVAFVGGCTTSLLLTDEFTREQVRHTDDVDLIVHLVGYASYSGFQKQLRSLGFSENIENDDPICAMRLGELRVDFMPDDESILGFSNRWYSEAINSAVKYQLNDTLTINLITPVYFVATKLEAYHDRGNDDPMSSRDIEDILNLIDGRPELLNEIKRASPEIRRYIATEMQSLLVNSEFQYAVQSCALGDQEREDLIFERLDELRKLV